MAAGMEGTRRELAGDIHEHEPKHVLRADCSRLQAHDAAEGVADHDSRLANNLVDEALELLAPEAVAELDVRLVAVPEAQQTH
jgi:hypothetical protein